MVLRGSPWESRTSLTNDGHFAARGVCGGHTFQYKFTNPLFTQPYSL